MTTAEKIILAAMGRVFVIDMNGRVWRIKSGQTAEHSMPNGYRQIRWMVGRQRHHALSHRIVWMHANKADIPRRLTVNHKNGQKGDNRPENLEVVTPSENARHARRVLGTHDQRGTKNHQAKLHERTIEVIRSRRRAGDSLKSIAEDYGISDRNVSKICLGQRWKHV